MGRILGAKVPADGSSFLFDFFLPVIYICVNSFEGKEGDNKMKEIHSPSLSGSVPLAVA